MHAASYVGVDTATRDERGYHYYFGSDGWLYYGVPTGFTVFLR